MTLSELATTVAPESTIDTTGEWSNPVMSTNLPVFPQSKLAIQMEARNKMRLSVQMARLRSKLPPEERPPAVVTTSPRKSVDIEGGPVCSDACKISKEVMTPRTPPPPCNAFMPSENRQIVLNLLGTIDDEPEVWLETSPKLRKGSNLIRGWESSSNLLPRKVPQTAAEINNNRTNCTTRNTQRRCSTSSGTDIKLKNNIYDRYNTISPNDTFKFFHYADLRLYIKQYRRNHSCGIGQRGQNASLSPVYDYCLYRLDDSGDKTRSYHYNSRRAKDGFVLGVQSTPATSSVWKANLPMQAAFRQKVANERRQPLEEPILSPRVFARQNGAFSHLWKTKQDGIPDPFIAVTRPPTTPRSLRSTSEDNKENQSVVTSTTKSSPDLESHGEIQRETQAWRIMKMLATCSLHSRTDGSNSTTTNECKSRPSDIDPSRDPEESQGTGETISNSTTPDTAIENRGECDESAFGRLKTNSALGNMPSIDKPVIYNRTRSILSNMSDRLNFYIESENSVGVTSTNAFSAKVKMSESLLEESSKMLENDAKDNAQRKRLVFIRKELRNLASRRSPSRQKLPSPFDLSKIGSLVLPESKNYGIQRPVIRTPTPQRARITPTKEIRKISPSPVKLGHAGYKRPQLDVELVDANQPMLFVKRSQLLPTVSASVEAMKSRQVMLHSRHLHPADSKQFTKITDLLRNHSSNVPPSTRERSSLSRRVASRTQSVSETRFIHSSYAKSK